MAEITIQLKKVKKLTVQAFFPSAFCLLPSAFLHLAYILAARPQALPNQWIVELADEALGREGRLMQVTQRHRALLSIKP